MLDLNLTSMDADMDPDLEPWCDGCRSLRLELDQVKSDHAINYKTLKEKIIPTDLLIKKYSSKCKEYEIQAKKLEDMSKRLEVYQKDCDTFSNQLKLALQEVEPLKMAKDKLERKRQQSEKKIDELRVEILSREGIIKQYKDMQAKQEQEVTSLEQEKGQFNKKIRELEISLRKAEQAGKKSQDEVEKRKEDLSSQRQKSNKLQRENQKLESRLTRCEEILRNHGMHKELKRLGLNHNAATGSLDVMSITSSIAHTSDLMSVMSEEDEESDTDIPDVELIFAEMGLSGKDRRSAVQMELLEPIVPALSPLPYSPAPSTMRHHSSSESDQGGNNSSEDSVDDMADLLDSHLLSPAKSPERIKKKSPIHTKNSPVRSGHRINPVHLKKSPLNQHGLNRQSRFGSPPYHPKPIAKYPPKKPFQRTTRARKPLADEENFTSRRHSKTPLMSVKSTEKSLDDESVASGEKVMEASSLFSSPDKRMLSESTDSEKEGSGSRYKNVVLPKRRNSRILSKQDTGSFEVIGGEAMEPLKEEVVGCKSLINSVKTSVETSSLILPDCDKTNGETTNVKNTTSEINKIKPDCDNLKNITNTKSAENSKDATLKETKKLPEKLLVTELISKQKNTDNSTNLSLKINVDNDLEISSSSNEDDDDEKSTQKTLSSLRRSPRLSPRLSGGQKSPKTLSSSNLKSLKGFFDAKEMWCQPMLKSPNSVTCAEKQLKSPPLRRRTRSHGFSSVVEDVEDDDSKLFNSNDKKSPKISYLKSPESAVEKDSFLAIHSLRRRTRSEGIGNKPNLNEITRLSVDEKITLKSGSVSNLDRSKYSDCGKIEDNSECLLRNDEVISLQLTGSSVLTKTVENVSSKITTASENVSTEIAISSENVLSEITTTSENVSPEIIKTSEKVSSKSAIASGNLSSEITKTSEKVSSESTVSLENVSAEITKASEIVTRRRTRSHTLSDSSGAESDNSSSLSGRSHKVKKWSKIKPLHSLSDIKNKVNDETVGVNNVNRSSAFKKPLPVNIECTPPRKLTRSQSSPASSTSYLPEKDIDKGEHFHVESDKVKHDDSLVDETIRRNRFKTGEVNGEQSYKEGNLEDTETNEIDNNEDDSELESFNQSSGNIIVEKDTIKNDIDLENSVENTLDEGINELTEQGMEGSKEKDRAAKSMKFMEDSKEIDRVAESKEGMNDSKPKDRLAESMKGMEDSKEIDRVAESKPAKITLNRRSTLHRQKTNVNGGIINTNSSENIESKSSSGINEGPGSTSSVLAFSGIDENSEVVTKEFSTQESEEEIVLMKSLGFDTSHIMDSSLNIVDESSESTDDNLQNDTEQMIDKNVKSVEENKVMDSSSALSAIPEHVIIKPCLDKQISLPEESLGCISPLSHLPHMISPLPPTPMRQDSQSSVSSTRTVSSTASDKSEKLKPKGKGKKKICVNKIVDIEENYQEMHQVKTRIAHKVNVNDQNVHGKTDVTVSKGKPQNEHSGSPSEILSEVAKGIISPRKAALRIMKEGTKVSKQLVLDNNENETGGPALTGSSPSSKPSTTGCSLRGSSIVSSKIAQAIGKGHRTTQMIDIPAAVMSKRGKKAVKKGQPQLKWQPGKYMMPKYLKDESINKSVNQATQQTVNREKITSASSCPEEVSKGMVSIEIKNTVQSNIKQGNAASKGLNKQAGVNKFISFVKGADSIQGTVVDKGESVMNKFLSVVDTRQATDYSDVMELNTQIAEPSDLNVIDQGSSVKAGSFEGIASTSGQTEAVNSNIEETNRKKSKKKKKKGKRKSNEQLAPECSEPKMAHLSVDEQLTDSLSSETRNIDKELQFVFKFHSVPTSIITDRLCRSQPCVTPATLADRIIHNLLQNTSDVINERRSKFNLPGGQHINNENWGSVLTESDTRVIELLDLVSLKLSMENVLDIFLTKAAQTIIKDHQSTLLGKCAVTRIFTAICKKYDFFDRLKIVAYDLVYFKVGDYSTLLANAAMVWLHVFRKSDVHTGVQPLTTVLEHVIMSEPSDESSTSLKEKTVQRCLRCLCRWQSIEADVVLQHLLWSLNEKCMAACDNDKVKSDIFESLKCLELLSVHKGWEWTNNVLVITYIWPPLQQWVADIANCTYSLTYVESLFKLLGIIGIHCPLEHKEAVKDIIKTLSVLCGPDYAEKVPNSTQFYIVESITLLTPFNMVSAIQTCNKWLMGNKQHLNTEQKSYLRDYFAHYKQRLKGLSVDI